jgi:hypothetical protein
MRSITGPSLYAPRAYSLRRLWRPPRLATESLTTKSRHRKLGERLQMRNGARMSILKVGISPATWQLLCWNLQQGADHVCKAYRNTPGPRSSSFARYRRRVKNRQLGARSRSSGSFHRQRSAFRQHRPSTRRPATGSNANFCCLHRVMSRTSQKLSYAWTRDYAILPLLRVFLRYFNLPVGLLRSPLGGIIRS